MAIETYSIERLHAANVANLLKQPGRIVQLVYPGAPATWPPANGARPIDMLIVCRARMRQLRACEEAICRIIGLLP